MADGAADRPAVLITGATGFVGRHLAAQLAARHRVTLATRRPHEAAAPCAVVGEINGDTDWTEALRDVSTVVHLANRAHVMHETAVDPLALYREVNVAGTLRLAEQAAAAGVRRLVYLSSVKVLGESTGAAPFADDSPACPADAYGQSKLEAEQMLRALAARTGLEVVILRPPLVYGPGVGANFRRLLAMVARGIPLPLAAVRNRRSLVFVGNLAAAIEACLEHPAAAGKTYLVCDGAAMSTGELVGRLAKALGVRDRSWPLPPALLRIAGRLSGKSGEVSRLLDSLELDCSGFCKDLGWRPPYSVDQGLAITAEWFRSAHA